MSLTGSARLEGTTRYRERFKVSAAPGHFRQQHDLWLSSIGTGSYLGDADDETDAHYTAAVIRAVQLGKKLGQVLVNALTGEVKLHIR